LGTIEPSPTSAPRARGISSLWKLSALKRSLHSALRAVRVLRTPSGSAATRSRWSRIAGRFRQC